MFGYTGSAQTFNVPPGVTSVTITADGGSGGPGSAPAVGVASGSPGLAGEVTGTVPVAGGQQLRILVGGAGTNGPRPGSNSSSNAGTAPAGAATASGGQGSMGDSEPEVALIGGGGGGGGADTEVDLVSPGSGQGTTPLIVAGGGGGGGGGGGAAGYSGGSGGSGASHPGNGNGGFGPGSGSGGSGQTGSAGGASASNPPSGSGAGGAGGGGAGYNPNGGGGGVAGGAGTFGAGGGGGGAAGASYASGTVGDATLGSAMSAGDGQVTVTWNPASLTASAGTVNAGSPVTLTDTIAPAGVSTASPTGTVTFEQVNNDRSPTILGTASLQGRGTDPGVASITTSSLSSGRDLVEAFYGGDANNPASSASLFETVVEPASASISAPSTVHFNLIPVGGHESMPVTVTSNGPGQLSVSSVALGGAAEFSNPGVFSITGNTCLGNPMPAGATCGFTINYNPTAVTTEDNATLTVTDNAGDSPQTLSLIAQAEGTATPEITSIQPSNGVPGSSVTITGLHLASLSAVDFGPNNSSPYVNCGNGTSCTATVPAGTPGTVNVSVTNSQGTSTVGAIAPAAASQFTYLNTTAFSVSPNPDAIVLSPDGTRAYVAGETHRGINVVNTATNSVIASVGVGSSPTGLALSPNGRYLYVANMFSNTVSVVDTTTLTVVATVPVGNSPAQVAVSPDGTRVYVTNNGSSTISVINAAGASSSVITTIGGGSAPYGIVISPNGQFLYVGDQGSGTVTAYEITGGTPSRVASIPVGSGPAGLAITPDGSRLYVTNDLSNTVTMIGTTGASFGQVVTLNVGSEPFAAAVSPDGHYVYVANDVSNSVSIIDNTQATPTVIGGDALPVLTGPDAVAVSSNSQNVYVAGFGSSNVTLLPAP